MNQERLLKEIQRLIEANDIVPYEEPSESEQKLYALIQSYTGSIDVILDTNREITLKHTKRNELVALCDEALTSLDDITGKELNNLKTTDEILKFKEVYNDAKKSFSSLLDRLKEEKVLAVQEVRSFIKESFIALRTILSTKLPKSLIASIALSNPLTAIIYENADLIGGIAKAITYIFTGNKKGDNKWS